MKFLLATASAALLFAVTSCATGSNESYSETLKNATVDGYNGTKILVKQSYANVKDIASEYCLTLVNTAKSFNTEAPKNLDSHFMVDESTLKPGYVYTTNEVTPIFSIIDFGSILDDKNLMKASVSGKSTMIDPFTWAFEGDTTYLFEYRFVWFNAKGEVVNSNVPAHIRETIPGDRVNFVGHAPSEDCTQFSMVLALVKPEPVNAEDEDSDTVAVFVGNAPADAEKK